MNIENTIKHFVECIKGREVEIYNEASVQYELAIFLRNKINKDYKIQIERNIKFFELPKKDFENGKKEIDIVIFDSDKKDNLAIEIKFPTNGQCPEQIFSFCKDIKFLEQLKKNGFKNILFLVFTDDSNFWDGSSHSGIYRMFRDKKRICGTITKPTRPKNEEVKLNGKYDIRWQDVLDGIKYFLITV